MLSNLAMEEQRKIYFSEIDSMGKGAPTQLPPSPIPARPGLKSGNGQAGANRA
jgi:hypothetical protein